MKFLIASDIHGSAFYAEKVVARATEENADKIILLGDVYNHGPRNRLPDEYEPMRVAEIFNAVKDNLIVIKGNCDSAVDTMISDFDFIDSAVLAVGEKSVFLTHGHVYNKDKLPKTKFDAIIYGHFHTGFIEKTDGVTFCNVGSTSLPKNNTPNSYAILDGKKLTLKTIDGKVIAECDL